MTISPSNTLPAPSPETIAREAQLFAGLFEGHVATMQSRGNPIAAAVVADIAAGLRELADEATPMEAQHA